MSHRYTHPFDQIGSGPKIMEKLIMSNISETLSSMMKKLENFLTSQRKPKKLSLRDYLSKIG